MNRAKVFTLALATILLASRSMAAPCDVGAAGPAKSHKVKEVLSALGNVPTKNEYETTDAYRDRLATSLARVAPLGHQLAFLLPFEGDAKYNADAGELVVSTKPVTPFAKIIQEVTQRETGSFRASNAFGVTTRVTQHLVREYGLFLGETNGFQLGGALVMPLPPPEARRTRDNLSVLVIGALAPPYRITNNLFRSATISDPEQVHRISEVLALDLTCAALYDRDRKIVVASLIPMLSLEIRMLSLEAELSRIQSQPSQDARIKAWMTR